ncbi:MAG: DMT family transporter [Rhodospirillaceae bacterium]|nr:DMT family transporter [Rhodospirillaceae bacterium]MBL6930555.1 DMT family transporter [Rhodospirillales bacterium]
MAPAFWGLLTALSWGSADFIARFTGRAVGHHAALSGMLFFSAIFFSAIVFFTGLPLIWEVSAIGWLVVTGLGAMVATLLLYWGLARGPVTIVAPIAAGYPVINILYVLYMGNSPSGMQWLAFAGVMGGVYIVARCAKNFQDEEEFTSSELKKTVAISLGAAVAFGVTVIALQEAGKVYGELQTVFLARWISFAAILVVLSWRRRSVSIPFRWWPLIGLQGLLDGGAFMALVIGGGAVGGEVAAVVGSSFSAVTILLARWFLKEVMSGLQWVGIALIIVGVGVLLAL